MKGNIVKKIISLGMAFCITAGFIPNNLVYAASQKIVVSEENTNEEIESGVENISEENKVDIESNIEDSDVENTNTEEKVEDDVSNKEDLNEVTDDISKEEINSKSTTSITADVIESIKISSNNAYNGSKIKVEVDIKDSEKENIESLSLSWKSEENSVGNSTYLYFNEESGIYEGMFYVPTYIDSSTKLILDKVTIYTNDYEEVYFNRDDLYNQGINLEKLDINVERWKAIIKSININSNTLSKDQKVKVEVEVDSSQIEDIRYMNIEWEDKDSYYSIYESLEYNEKTGKFEGQISGTSMDTDRNMIFKEIYISPNTYGSTYIYRSDLENQGINVDKLDINLKQWKPSIKSINLSNKEMYYPLPGYYQTDISVELENPNEIKKIEYGYDNEDYVSDDYLKYNKSTGKFEGTYIFGKKQSGKFNYLKIYLKDDSYRTIERDELTDFGFDIDIFDVNMNNIDIPYNITLDKKEVKTGETIKISMDLGKYKDYVKYLTLEYENDTVNSHITEKFNLEYNKNTKLYEYEFTPDIFSDTRNLSLYRIELHGYNGESTRIYNLSQELINNSKFKIVSNFNEYINEIISDINININKKSFKLGERLKISIDNLGGDSSKNVSITFRNKDDDTNQNISLYYNSKTKKWEGILDIDAKISGGNWFIDYISMYFPDGEYSYYSKYADIYNKDYYTNEEFIMDFSDYNFKVDNSIKDTEAPTIKGISVDKKQGTLGDKFIISVDAVDDISGIDEIYIEYANKYEMWGYDSRKIKVNYNPITKKYEGEIAVDAAMVNGKYHVNYVYLRDNVGNESRVYYGDLDLSDGDFEVIDNIQNGYDIIDSMHVSKKVTFVGDTVDFEVKLKNNNLINSIDLEYYITSVNNEIPEVVNLKYDKLSQSFKGSMKVGRFTPVDDWICTGITFNIGDDVKNYQSIEGHRELGFEVLSENNNTTTILSATVDKTSVTIGDTVKLSIEASDRKKIINNIKAIYSVPSCNEVEIVELEKSNDIYTGSISIGKNSAPGKWTIDSLIIEDSDGNKTKITNYINNNEDFASAEFEVYNTEYDITPPELISINIDNKEPVKGEQVKVSIKAKDLHSEIESVKAAFSYDQTNDFYVDLKEFVYNESTDSYEYTIDTNKINDFKEYVFSNEIVEILTLIITDTNGNKLELGYDDKILKNECIYVSNGPKEWYVNEITNQSKYVDGYVQKNTNVNISVNNNTYSGVSDSKGYFKIEIPKQSVKSKVVIDLLTVDKKQTIRTFEMIVIEGKEPPVIIANDKTIKVGDKINLLDGITASDKEDGNITSKIKVVESSVDTTKVGTYKVVYEVTDSDGNKVTKEIKVTVRSNEKPEISAKDVVLKVGDKFDAMSGVSASDKEDGNITSSIKVTENTVDTTKAGIYKVVYEVIDSDGNKAKKEIKVTVNLNKVSDVKATASSYNSNKITWSKLTGADGYEIYRSTSKTGTYKSVKTITNGSTVSYTDKSLATGTTYYYKVRAYKTVNGNRVYGDFSSVSYAKPVLSKPTTVKAVSASYNSNKITWNKVTGASGYVIYRATSKTGTYKSVKTISSGSTVNYTNTSLTTGSTYYYKIRAYRTVDGKKVYSGYSAITSAKPALKTPSITLTAGSKKATVKWSKVSGANGYEIYRATRKTGKYSKVKTIAKNSTVSYTNSSLTKGKTYYYKMRAYRTVNGKKVYSSYSTVKSVKIK